MRLLAIAAMTAALAFGLAVPAAAPVTAAPCSVQQVRKPPRKPKPTSTPTATPTPTPTPTLTPTHTPTPTPTTPTPTPAARSLYGTATATDALQNWQVGGQSSRVVSNRWRAARTGNLTAWRTWLKNMGTVAVGYGAGDGGVFAVTVETDSNGLPSGTVLGTGTARPGAADASGINPGRFSLWTFDGPVPVVAGNMYHIVYRNVHADPVNNYASVNHLVILASDVPAQPISPDDTLNALTKDGASAWVLRRGSTPILDLTYSDGSHDGQGYMEPEYNSPAFTGTATMLRERFTVTGGDRTVASVAVRVGKTSGSGNLVIGLQDSAGTLIESVAVSTAGVPITSRTTNTATSTWLTATFAAPRTLSNGATYSLRLSTDAATVLWARGIQQGNAYGFDAATYFTDGVYQYTTNGGTSWSYIAGLDVYGDLPFYLS